MMIFSVSSHVRDVGEMYNFVWKRIRKGKAEGWIKNPTTYLSTKSHISKLI